MSEQLDNTAAISSTTIGAARGAYKTDDSGERVFVTQGELDRLEGQKKPWYADRLDEIRSEISDDPNTKYLNAQPIVVDDGTVYFPATGEYQIHDPNKVSERTWTILQGIEKHQLKAELGMNPNRYDEYQAAQVLSGEVITPAEMGYDQRAAYQLIQSAKRDPKFLEYLENVTAEELDQVKQSFTEEQHKWFGNAARQFGAHVDGGLVDKAGLIAAIAHYKLFPESRQQQMQGMHPQQAQSNQQYPTTVYEKERYLSSQWGVGKDEIHRRVNIISELAALAGKSIESISLSEAVGIWNNYECGGYNSQLQQLNRRDLVY
ncbi:hypothetical protein [Fischerella sp. PCC 9605]|uniref:hypothetical protein n=1 Tax=Fischerella sp. PCC 9605 TaxID=1173024 RepID=UPI00047C253C|nr:hypothetical protein [Fischerella sp. PCC 9605]